jgi:hypothetical protein
MNAQPSCGHIFDVQTGDGIKTLINSDTFSRCQIHDPRQRCASFILPVDLDQHILI